MQNQKDNVLSGLSFGDFNIEIPGDIDVVDKDQLLSEDFNTKKIADLYNDVLYTVINKDHDIKLGILPQDQGFSDKHIILWSSLKSIPIEWVDKFNIVSVKISSETKKNYLKSLGAGIYSLTDINNNFKLKIVKSWGNLYGV